MSKFNCVAVIADPALIHDLIKGGSVAFWNEECRFHLTTWLPESSYKSLLIVQMRNYMTKAQLKELESKEIVSGRCAWIEKNQTGTLPLSMIFGQPQTQEERCASQIYWCGNCGKTQVGGAYIA